MEIYCIINCKNGGCAGNDSEKILSGVHFIKHDIQGVFLKCAEILPARL
jgi:aspartate carbamoyltransferase regulatory subunit